MLPIKIATDNSPNYSKKIRNYKDIKFVIIHYTGMQSEIESLKRLKSPKYKVSCHYLINRKGLITKMVPDTKIAWHAGKSKWKKINNLNKYSLGIELVNKGHKFGYEKYSELQIKSLIKLCTYLKKKYNFKNESFLGHSDIAPFRKLDPGEKFPWKRLSKLKIGFWYQKKIFENLTKNEVDIRSTFFKNIYKIGYRFFNLSKKSNKDHKIIRNFQRRFLPNEVNGKITDKTLKISQLLALKSNLT